MRVSGRVVVCLTAVSCMAIAGCMAIGREAYTSPVGAGARPVFAPERVPVGSDNNGTIFSQDPSAVLASTAPSDVVVSVCDWRESLWFLVFPPVPIPLVSLADQPGRPNTTVVRITFGGPGQWRASFADLALLGPEGARTTPDRYRLVIARKAETLENGLIKSEIEPCQRTVEPAKSVAEAKFAVLEKGELFLTFNTLDFPKGGERTLALDGITRDGVKVPLPHLALESGARWFWYRAFP